MQKANLLGYVRVVPRSFFSDDLPADYETAWLDGENSILCAECACASDREDEVPQFRPVTPVNSFVKGERCDQCSCLLADDFDPVCPTCGGELRDGICISGCDDL